MYTQAISTNPGLSFNHTTGAVSETVVGTSIYALKLNWNGARTSRNVVMCIPVVSN